MKKTIHLDLFDLILIIICGITIGVLVFVTIYQMKEISKEPQIEYVEVIKEKEVIRYKEKEYEYYELYILKTNGEELEYSYVIYHDLNNIGFIEIRNKYGETIFLRLTIDEIEQIIMDME